jgi:hypothetical protein
MLETHRQHLLKYNGTRFFSFLFYLPRSKFSNTISKNEAVDCPFLRTYEHIISKKKVRQDLTYTKYSIKMGP